MPLPETGREQPARGDGRLKVRFVEKPPGPRAASANRCNGRVRVASRHQAVVPRTNLRTHDTERLSRVVIPSTLAREVVVTPIEKVVRPARIEDADVLAELVDYAGEGLPSYL